MSHTPSTSHHATSIDRAKYIPPWTEPYIIGVSGFSGSGKTAVSSKIIRDLNQPWTVLLSFDNFYKALDEPLRQLAMQCEYDFDMPLSFDIDYFYETVKAIKRGEKTSIPVYSFKLHNRTKKCTTIYGANVIIIEGIYALYDPRLLELMDLKVFVDTDLDVCLARRLTRDILERGRDLEGALRQWETFVKPNSVRYVYPTLQNADIVLPRGLENTIAIDLMIKHIQSQLALKSARHLQNLERLGVNTHIDIEQHSEIIVLPATNQTLVMNSILLNSRTERLDFVFYFDRIANLIFEAALGFADQYTESKQVETSASHPPYTYDGLALTREIVAVTAIYSGDCFTNSIRKTFPDIPLGKLLIQSDAQTGEPQLHYESLPPEVADPTKSVFFFDSQVISGAAAIMAIQVLLDHKVEEHNITVCTYLCTEIGICRIKRVFPKVNMVVGKLLAINPTQEQQFNPERFCDSDWHFCNRFIDALYFGAD